MKKTKNILFLIIILLISCTNKKREEDNLINFENKDSLNLFIKYIESDTINKIDLLKYNNSSYNFIKDKESNDTLVRLNLLKIVKCFYKLNQSKLFKESNKLLLKKAIEKKDTIIIANSYYLNANSLFDSGIIDSSYYFYLKAEKFFLKFDDTKNLGNLYLNKSAIQLEINDLYGAEYSATQALKYLKLNNNILGQYDALTNLGIVSNESENYEKAIDYHKKALLIAKSFPKSKKYYLEEVSLNNIGNTFQNSKKYKEAINVFNTALLDKTLEKNKPSLYATLIDNIAYSKFKLNENNDLPKLFLKALKIRDSLKLSSKIIFSKIHLSEYYFDMNDELNSEKYAIEALKLSRKSNSPVDVLASLKQLSIVDKNKSTTFSKEYFKLSDSLQVAERISKDRFARIQFETNEIIQQKDDLEEKNRNILNYFMGTILIGGVMFFLRSQRAKNRELILRQAQQKANEDIYKLIITQQNKLDEGRVLEKTRIAKELHDGVLGRLFGLRLNLDGLNDRKDEESVEMRLQYLNELKNIEQDLREISHELSREKFVLINNFVAIVSNLLDEQTKVNNANLKTFIGEDIDWDVLSNTTKINLYRILQESLQNINKYANAKNIKVDFKKDKKGNLILNIVDDGIGFDVDKKTRGIGIQNIISRTHESQGIIDIKSEKNKGTRITITVPLEGKTIKI